MVESLYRSQSCPILKGDVTSLPIVSKSAQDISTHEESLSELFEAQPVISLLGETPEPHLVHWKPCDESTAFFLIKSPRSDWYPIIEKILGDSADGKEYIILRSLVYELIRFCVDKEYHELETAIVIDIFLATHHFFVSSPWRSYKETYDFFKENLLIHSVYDPPHSVRDFNLMQTLEIIEYFCAIYLPMLPLLRVACHPNLILEVSWRTTSRRTTSRHSKSQNFDKQTSLI